VDDIVNVRVLGEDLVQRGLVGDVALVEGGPLAADELDAIDHLGRRVVQVVDDDDLVVGLQKGERREGADVARATVGSQSMLITVRCSVAWSCHGGVEEEGRSPGNEDRSDDHFGGLECEEVWN
jgi:hypothetical protein